MLRAKLSLIAAILMMAYLLQSQTPPIPGVNVRLEWDPNPPAQQVTSYTIWMSTNVSGPFASTLECSGSSTSCVVNLPARGTYFFYVVSSNFWGVSPPSNMVNTPDPASRVNGTKILKVD